MSEIIDFATEIALRQSVHSALACIEKPRTQAHAITLARALQAEADAMWLRAVELAREPGMKPR